MKRITLTAIILITIALMTSVIYSGCGCGKSNQEGATDATQEQDTTHPLETEGATASTEQPGTSSELPKEVRELVDALLATSELNSFTVTTNADIHLEGNFITGEFLIDSTVAVEHPTADNLTMKLRTTSNQDDVVSYAYYQDGWYYTDDKKGKNKLEKTSKEVLAGVTDITDMVIDAAASITDMQVTREGTDTIYTYSIPSDEAEQYFSQVTARLGETNEQIAGASAQVAEIALNSTVNEEGYVTSQQVYLLGKMKKSIFKIPAEVSVTAEFAKGAQTDFEFPETYEEWE